MNSQRIKEIQETTAYPESVSVKQALLQVWNECEQESNKKTTSQQQTIERLYNSVVNVKNPYSREKQYQQWAAAENVLDTIIRSAPFQEVKQLLNTTEPIDQ